MSKTKPTGLTLFPHELSAASVSDLGLIVRVLKKQPPQNALEAFSWFEPKLPKAVKAEEGCYYRTEQGLFFLCPCPFPIGATLYGREAWLYADANDAPISQLRSPEGFHPGDLNYKAEATRDDLIWLAEEGFRWRRANTMPFWASRFRWQVVGVECKRLREFSHVEAIQWGCPPHPLCDSQTVNGDLERLWNTTAKPGQGWEENPWTWFVKVEVMK